MKWKDLSEEAKSIIEWVISPITNCKHTIKIKIGELFHGYSSNINILITETLYQEILKYVSGQGDLNYEQFGNMLTFQLKNEMEI